MNIMGQFHDTNFKYMAMLAKTQRSKFNIFFLVHACLVAGLPEAISNLRDAVNNVDLADTSLTELSRFWNNVQDRVRSVMDGMADGKQTQCNNCTILDTKKLRIMSWTLELSTYQLTHTHTYISICYSNIIVIVL